MAANKLYPATPSALDGPYVGAFAVTPHDTNELAVCTRAIQCGGVGTLTFTPAFPVGGANVTMTVPAGAWVPVMATKILATGTTATLIVAFY